MPSIYMSDAILKQGKMFFLIQPQCNCCNKGGGGGGGELQGLDRVVLQNKSLQHLSVLKKYCLQHKHVWHKIDPKF